MTQNRECGSTNRHRSRGVVSERSLPDSTTKKEVNVCYFTGTMANSLEYHDSTASILDGALLFAYRETQNGIRGLRSVDGYCARNN